MQMREEPPAPKEEEAGWAPETVYTVGESFLLLPEI